MRQHQARARRVAEARSGPGTWRAGHCPIAALLDRGLVEAGSVDVVFTDPPYPREYLHTWRELGEFAAVALRPGGAVVALSGQSWLPQVLSALDVPDLQYRWCGAVTLPIIATQVMARRVNTGWKPILMYERSGGVPAVSWLGTDVAAGPARKQQADQFHEWGQAPEAMDAIAKLVRLRPGQVVVAPFAGGGETALAAWRLGCHVAAYDAAPDVAIRLASVTDSVTAIAA